MLFRFLLLSEVCFLFFSSVVVQPETDDKKRTARKQAKIERWKMWNTTHNTQENMASASSFCVARAPMQERKVSARSCGYTLLLSNAHRTRMQSWTYSELCMSWFCASAPLLAAATGNEFLERKKKLCAPIRTINEHIVRRARTRTHIK